MMTPKPKVKRGSVVQIRRILVDVVRDRATLIDRLLLAQALAPPRALMGLPQKRRRPDGR